MISRHCAQRSAQDGICVEDKMQAWGMSVCVRVSVDVGHWVSECLFDCDMRNRRTEGGVARAGTDGRIWRLYLGL